MARKKRRTEKQRAATRKLIAFNKKRRKKKTKTARRKTRARRKTTTRRKRRNPQKARPGLKKSHLWRVFLCKGQSVKWLTIASDLRYGWTADTNKAVFFKVKGNAEKYARKLQKRRGYAAYHVGVSDAAQTAAQIRNYCGSFKELTPKGKG